MLINSDREIEFWNFMFNQKSFVGFYTNKSWLEVAQVPKCSHRTRIIFSTPEYLEIHLLLAFSSKNDRSFLCGLISEKGQILLRKV